ncbi:MAG: glutathione S-transferase C-terminal domain-containing protein [Sphingobium sp.]|nr:glutathione S-transferase C-terminal domain-containing protein [Sphingobium sp.]
MARYGPTPLAPTPHDPNFAAYGIATLVIPVVVSCFLAPEAERENWGATWCLRSFQKRLKLVSQQLASSPYVAGDSFTAADISVTYALNRGQRNCGITLGHAEQAYGYFRRVGMFWAAAPPKSAIPLFSNNKLTVHHCLDIVGVASSILATPTMENPAILSMAGFSSS